MKRSGQKKKEGNERKEKSKGGREESRKGRQEVKGAAKYLHFLFFQSRILRNRMP